MRRDSSIFADPSPCTSQQFSEVRTVGVSPRKVHLYLPRRPEIAAALEPSEQWGKWYLLRADSPFEVFNHLRQLLAGGFECTKSGHCQRPGAPCPIETVAVGTWQRVLDTVADEGSPATPRPTPNVRASIAYPRWNTIGKGSWSVPLPDEQ